MKNISLNKWYEWKEAPPADYAVIGDPINHSLSPLIHNKAFKYLGLSKIYHAIRVPYEEFFDAVTYLKSLGYFGLNVTAPLKENAYQWAENKDKYLTAYNTLNLKTKEGINTDLPGFYKTLSYKKWDNPCSILFLGGGATTKTLASFLIKKNFDVHIFTRNPKKIKNWTIRHYPLITLHSKIQSVSCQMIVNTLLPCHLVNYGNELNDFSLDTRFYDLNYMQYLDPLYQSIQKRFDYINGLRMLAEQGTLSLEWWLGKNISSQLMLETLQLA